VRAPADGLFDSAAALFQVGTSEGIAGDLDRLARRTVLREAGQVSGQGMLFLNVLPGSLADPEWHGGPVRELLEAAAIPPARLVLEVSERAADTHPEGLEEVCRGLRREGFRLSLDDVGTGFSSLASVERMRPDFLKVDVTLVRDLDVHLIKQEVVASVLHVAERLGCAVVAEGVETEAEAAVLRDLGARLAQGCLFAPPAPASVAGRTTRSPGAEH
jgi:EAL domain-containing protein (putative c-di-GMP-specific phosphodiesterase class I)